jgi:hypothetical protein
MTIKSRRNTNLFISFKNSIRNTFKTSFSDVKLQNIFDKTILFEPNFLLDILIRFLMISSFLYILYKYFIIDMTINYIIAQVPIHFNIYASRFKTVISEFIGLDNIYSYTNDQLNKLSNSPSTANPTVNDSNFAIIYGSMVGMLSVLIITVIVITGGYKHINYNNIIYNIILNLVIFVASQLVFFYLIYSYIDPLAFYKLLYFDYFINSSATTTTAPNQVLAKQPTTAQSGIISTTTSSNALAQNKNIPNSNLINLTNTSNSQDILLDSSGIATIFVFTMIFLVLLIIFIIITVLNLLSVYTNFNLMKLLIPLNINSLPIYSIITISLLFLFIILLLLLLRKI